MQITIHSCPCFAINCSPLAASPTPRHPTDQVTYLHRRQQQRQPFRLTHSPWWCHPHHTSHSRSLSFDKGHFIVRICAGFLVLLTTPGTSSEDTPSSAPQPPCLPVHRWSRCPTSLPSAGHVLQGGDGQLEQCAPESREHPHPTASVPHNYGHSQKDSHHQPSHPYTISKREREKIMGPTTL
jgi:hypothetical protein